jgi:hypothetical protein
MMVTSAPLWWCPPLFCWCLPLFCWCLSPFDVFLKQIFSFQQIFWLSSYKFLQQ